MKLIKTTLAVILALMLGACALADGITVTYVTSPLNVPSIVEKDGAWLAKALGMDVEYAQIDSGADQTAALASGDIQILNAVGGTSVILAAANGADIKIISMYSRSPEAFMMFSNDESIDSPEALRGKTIAGPKGTNLHELLVSYLATGGMTIDDVDYISMDIPSSLAALEGGSVDAALLAGAAAYNCMNGGKHLVTTGKDLIAATILTATTQEYYDANKEIVDTFLATQNEIVAYMNENHDEVIAMAAEALSLDVEAVESMYAMYDFNPEISEADIAALQATEQFMLNSGMIEYTVDVNDIILER
jgi:sulfonate transport system substrate-binding protein